MSVSVPVSATAADPALLARIYSRCTPDPETGCMLWTGALSSQGRYPTLGINGKVEYAHRQAYFALYGHLPQGSIRHESSSIELHHSCANPQCCNPQHLRPMTRRLHARTHAGTPRRRKAVAA